MKVARMQKAVAIPLIVITDSKLTNETKRELIEWLYATKRITVNEYREFNARISTESCRG